MELWMQERFEISVDMFLEVCEMIAKHGGYDSVGCGCLTTPTDGNAFDGLAASEKSNL